MSPKRTLFLVIVLAFLVGVYYYLDLGARKRQQAEEAEARIVKLEPAKVTSLEVRRGEERIKLEKEAGSWKVTAPISTGGDGEAIRSFLETLQEVKRESLVVDKAPDLKDFGLKPSRLSIHFEMEGGKGSVLHLGDDNPAGSGVYASLDDSPRVFLLPAGARERVGRSLYDLRDKGLIKVRRQEIRQIALERPGETFTLEKGERGWEMTSPAKALADTSVVDRTLDAFLTGRAQSFAEEDPKELKRYGLDSPDIRLSFAKEGGKEPVTFLIGKKVDGDKGYYARRGASGPVFVLERWTVEDLPKKALEARDRRIFDFEKEAVSQVEIKGPKGEVLAKKVKKDEWEVQGDDRLKGSERRISDLLWDIKYAKIAGFFDDPASRPDPKGVAEPTRTVTLTVEGKKDPLRFFVGQQVPGQENWYAKRATDDEIFLLSKDTVDRASKTAFDLQERKVLTFAYPDIEKMKVTYPKETVTLLKKGRRWWMEEPLKEIAVADRVDFLLNELYFLEFDDLAPPGKVDFNTPDVLVSLSQGPKGELPSLRFVYDPKEKKLYVRRGEEKTAYTLEVRFFEQLPKSHLGFLTVIR